MQDRNHYTYHGYTISPDDEHPMGGWGYVHGQYDGPPDPRCGHAKTLEQAKVEIEDLVALHPAMHRVKPFVCHGQDPDDRPAKPAYRKATPADMARQKRLVLAELRRARAARLGAV